MAKSILERVDEADFADMFQPAPKEELVAKRGWALFNSERSDVVLLSTFEEALEYAKIKRDWFQQNYRQVKNFYGVTDKESGATFLVLVDLSKKIQVFDDKGDNVKYFME